MYRDVFQYIRIIFCVSVMFAECTFLRGECQRFECAIVCTLLLQLTLCLLQCAKLFVRWMHGASRQSHFEISFSLSFLLHWLILFFMTSPSCKGFAFSPEKDQCTACGHVIVAGPMGLSHHLATSHMCSKDYEAQFNPHRQQVLSFHANV